MTGWKQTTSVKKKQHRIQMEMAVCINAYINTYVSNKTSVTRHTYYWCNFHLQLILPWKPWLMFQFILFMMLFVNAYLVQNTSTISALGASGLTVTHHLRVSGVRNAKEVLNSPSKSQSTARNQNLSGKSLAAG